MDVTVSEPDDSGRRAFKPPRRHKRRETVPRERRFNLWDMREDFGYGLTRAACAVGFGFVPSASERFGDLGLTVVAVILGALMLAILVLVIRIGGPVEWRLGADAVTLVVLTPVLVMASGIEVADARLGGRSSNFLAAAVALVLIYLIVVTIASRCGADRNAASQIGALPGALSIAVIILGTTHFSAGTIWRGLSIAWMVAAVATVLAMFVPLKFRVFVAPAVFALFSFSVLLPDFLDGESQVLNTGNTGIAVLVIAAVALILVLIPLPQRAPKNVMPPRDGTGSGM